jgi:hypothetical protein
VNAALRLFAATGEPMDFPAYVDLNRVLRRGETTKLCFEALAADGPMDTRQLTERVMKAKGLDFGDKVPAQATRGGYVQRIALVVASTYLLRTSSTKEHCCAANSPSTLY